MKEFIDKLIDKLGKLRDRYQDKYGFCSDSVDYGKTIGLNDAISIVTELAEEYKGGWIPCSSGNFPTTEVLVCREDGTIDFDVYCFMYEDWRYNSKHHKNKVIAWMPLPAPYTEGE